MAFMRKKIVAGNWKMNLVSEQAIELVNDIQNGLSDESGDVEVIVFPPAVFLRDVSKHSGKVHVGAQNFFPQESGAYTGEISVKHVLDAGATYVLIGHSERRMIFGETNQFLKQKVDVALANGLKVVFCCGEPLEVRDSGTELEYVKQQLIESLFHLPATSMSTVVIAYEPVWAIGTGKTATVAQAEEMHAAIRSWIEMHYNKEIAENCSVLYGGSCNAANAQELFTCPNVDGGLIGGASLQSESFLSIMQSF